jgi:hypothetical protein
MKISKKFKISRVSRAVAMAAAVAGLWGAAGDAHSMERRFVYSYEAQPFVPNQLEMETWLTWKDTGSGSGSYTFRHELEYTFTEKLQLGLYLPTWEYEDDSADIKSIDLEAIYNLTDPNESFLGSSLYGEVKIWDEFLKLETKLLLQKNFGPLVVAYNAVVEAEWEHEGLEDTEGELKQTLGVSYMVSPKFAFGAEGFQELKIPDWSWDQRESSAVYLGPNASLRLGRNWLTVAALWEVTHTEEEDFQVRAIWGLHF